MDTDKLNFKRVYRACPYNLEVKITGTVNNPIINIEQLNKCSLAYEILKDDWAGIEGFRPSDPPCPFRFFDANHGQFELSFKRIHDFLRSEIKYQIQDFEKASENIFKELREEMEKIKKTRKQLEYSEY